MQEKKKKNGLERWFSQQNAYYANKQGDSNPVSITFLKIWLMLVIPALGVVEVMWRQDDPWDWLVSLLD